MLREISDVRQVDGEPLRRWFGSANLDLVVWLSEQAVPVGFQLCYDKQRAERAITWRSGWRCPTHMAVDAGESSVMRYKGTPILVPGETLDLVAVRAAFVQECTQLPIAIREMILEKLACFDTDISS